MNPSPKTNRAFINVLVVVFLSLMAVVAAALISVTAVNLSAGDNNRRILNARLTAESGLQVMLRQMRHVRLKPDSTEAAYAADLGEELAARFDPTGNLGGANVAVVGSVVFVPTISLPYGTFSCTLDVGNPPTCLMTVRGESEGVVRRVSVALNMVEKLSPAFDYGVASKGPLSVFGNATIKGVNHPGEASILSATTSTAIAVGLDGSAVVEGDATVVEDPRYVVISGHPSLGGTSDPSKMADHVHAIPEAPQFPFLDVDPLKALAVNVIDSSTDISHKDQVFNNVRIAAGTNPVFSDDTVFNGVVYIEAPNTVTFTAKTTLNGVVVADGAGQQLTDCQISFAGQVEAYGVENLPDTPEFSAAKEQDGTFVLAPGFDVTFSGNFSAINGTIAADKLTFTGTAEGIVQGAVIGLTDEPLSIGGNVDILVDRSNANDNPAGFKKTIAFEPVEASYDETTGGN